MFNAMEFMLICLVAQAAVTDLAVRKIPNVLVASGLALALLLRWLLGGQGCALPLWLGGALAGLLLFLPLYLARGMAAGDVKLMAMVGSFVGPLEALRIGLLVFLIGGAMGLLMLLYSGRLRDGWRNLRALFAPLLLRLCGVPLLPAPLKPGASVGNMPYGLAIAVGTLLVLAWRHR